MVSEILRTRGPVSELQTAPGVIPPTLQNTITENPHQAAVPHRSWHLLAYISSLYASLALGSVLFSLPPRAVVQLNAESQPALIGPTRGPGTLQGTVRSRERLTLRCSALPLSLTLCWLMPSSFPAGRRA